MRRIYGKCDVIPNITTTTFISPVTLLSRNYFVVACKAGNAERCFWPIPFKCWSFKFCSMEEVLAQICI